MPGNTNDPKKELKQRIKSVKANAKIVRTTLAACVQTYETQESTVKDLQKQLSALQKIYDPDALPVAVSPSVPNQVAHQKKHEADYKRVEGALAAAAAGRKLASQNLDSARNRLLALYKEIQELQKQKKAL